MAHPIKCLRDEHGLCHVISDGPSPSRLFALCDIVAMEYKGSATNPCREITVPDRNWGEEDVVDDIVTCLTCVATIKEMIGA